ncbi:hypothetical protein AYI69_g9613 [Smittium culicis]|uniref:Uncharacterized protein n=1 Tax=Smittium culicis TaxID=133412 RepID=A0A1R1XBI3_9FUNG|nr:hypothetical protein AYI69_g9613 [Smittium culicis]
MLNSENRHENDKDEKSQENKDTKILESTVTVDADESSTVTVDADERSTVTVEADERSTVTVDADESSTVTVDADERSTVTVDADERSTVTVEVDERPTVTDDSMGNSFSMNDQQIMYDPAAQELTDKNDINRLIGLVLRNSGFGRKSIDAKAEPSVDRVYGGGPTRTNVVNRYTSPGLNTARAHQNNGASVSTFEGNERNYIRGNVIDLRRPTLSEDYADFRKPRTLDEPGVFVPVVRSTTEYMINPALI